MEWLSHGATIHIPLALGVLFPVFYLGCLWATRGNWLPFTIWYGLWGLGVLQLASSWIAFSSGEYSKILSSADLEQINRHEHFAFMFLYVWIGIALLLTIITWFKHLTVLRVVHALLFTLLIAQIFICMSLGRAGGALIIH